MFGKLKRSLIHHQVGGIGRIDGGINLETVKKYVLSTSLVHFSLASLQTDVGNTILLRKFEYWTLSLLTKISVQSDLQNFDVLPL